MWPCFPPPRIFFAHLSFHLSVFLCLVACIHFPSWAFFFPVLTPTDFPSLFVPFYLTSVHISMREQANSRREKPQSCILFLYSTLPTSLCSPFTISRLVSSVLGRRKDVYRTSVRGCSPHRFCRLPEAGKELVVILEIILLSSVGNSNSAHRHYDRCYHDAPAVFTQSHKKLRSL